MFLFIMSQHNSGGRSSYYSLVLLLFKLTSLQLKLKLSILCNNLLILLNSDSKKNIC